MQSPVSDFTLLETVYLLCAVAGGVLLAIRLLMMLIGVDDGGGHTDFDAHHVDGDASFKLLSIHGMTAFLMMFGLVGLAMSRESRMGMALSLVVAVAAGAASFWGIGKLFKGMRKLESSGTLDPSDAVGSEGEVYLTVPAGGTGSIMINFDNHYREFDASAESGGEIKTGTRIKVVKVEGSRMVVRPVRP